MSTLLGFVTSLGGFLVAYKSVLLPILTALIAWFVPSPMQKQQQTGIDIENEDNQIKKTGRPD